MKHSLLALSCLSAVSALNLPLRQTKRDIHESRRRSASSGQLIAVNDNQDMIYLVNLTLAGQQFTLQLDTGSSDLWVSSSGAALGNASNINVNLTYGLGYAYGPISTAPVDIAYFTIPKQAYVATKDANNPALQFGASGIMGTGMTRLSSIDMAVNQTGGGWGRSLLYNLFAQNPSEPNYMTMMLERVSDPDQQVTGSFTIGETDPRYPGITNTPPISTYPEDFPSRWTIIMDGIIANGNHISLSSSVKGAPSSKAVALMDSGTSLVYAPTSVVNAMYGNVPGAEYSDSMAQWIVPCDAEVDVSIIINGRTFDVHPLDTVQPSSSGSQLCTGSWLPQSLSIGQTEFDYLLGDAVMRSIYTLFDYGDFDSNGQMGKPYLQMWSLINGTEASHEFHQVRGGTSKTTFLSNDNVNAASQNSSSSSTGSSSDSSSSDISDLQTKVHNILKWAPVAIGVVALNIIIMSVVLFVSIAGCVRRRGNNRSVAPSGSFVPLPLGTSAHSYRPVSLQETPKYNSDARYSD